MNEVSFVVRMVPANISKSCMHTHAHRQSKIVRHLEEYMCTCTPYALVATPYVCDKARIANAFRIEAN